MEEDSEKVEEKSSQEFIHVNMIPAILKLLRKYNTKAGITKKIKKETIVKLDRYINILLKCLTINLCLIIDSVHLKIIQERFITQAIDLMLRGIDIQEFMNNKKFDTAYKNRNSDNLYSESIDPEIDLYAHTDIDDYTFLSKSVHELMLAVAHKNNKSLCDKKSNTAIRLIEILLTKIFDVSTEMITCESLIIVSTKPYFLNIDKELGEFNILGTDDIEV